MNGHCHICGQKVRCELFTSMNFEYDNLYYNLLFLQGICRRCRQNIEDLKIYNMEYHKIDKKIGRKRKKRRKTN